MNSLLDEARHEDVVVQASDGATFMVTFFDDFDEELAATRRNERLMKLLDERARSARNKGCVALDDVKKRLGLTS